MCSKFGNYSHKSTDPKCPENKKWKKEKEKRKEIEYKEKHFDGTCYHCGKKDQRIIYCYNLKSKEKRKKKAEKVWGDSKLSTMYDYWWTWNKSLRNGKIGFAIDVKFKKPMEARMM